MSHDIAMADAYSNKRKNPFGDTGDHEHKKVHLEDRRVGIENLHLDVGEKYLLCSTRKAPFGLIQSHAPSHHSFLYFFKKR